MATRDKAAHGIELGSGVVAGGIGTAFTGQKLRDAYKADYPSRFHPAAAKMEASAAAHAGARSEQAGKLARTLSHGRADGFVPLAAFTGAAVANRSAKKYRKRRKTKAMQQVAVAKSAATEVAHEAIKSGARGHVRGIGQVRVLHHHGNGNFMVLDRTDTKRLIHRDRIAFAKAAPGPGDSAFGVPIGKKDDALKLTGKFDDAVRTIKNKTLPPTGKLVAVGADKAVAVVQSQKQKLGKALDPHADHKRARAVEGVTGAGATAAAISSARAQKRGRHLANVSTIEARNRDRAYGAASRQAKPVAQDLHSFADSMKSRHGKGVSSEALRDTATAHRLSQDSLSAGQHHHYRAVHDAAAARGQLRRARNMRTAALGLGAAAVVADRQAHKHKP